MTLCPVALAVGCRKCPIFTLCPAKSIIGDQAPKSADAPKPEPKRKSGSKKR